MKDAGVVDRKPLQGIYKAWPSIAHFPAIAAQQVAFVNFDIYSDLPRRERAVDKAVGRSFQVLSVITEIYTPQLPCNSCATGCVSGL